MAQTIAAYEVILPHLETLTPQSRSFVLTRLAQLCYESTTFGAGFREAECARLRLGKAYGLESLRLNQRFADLEEVDFVAALAAVEDPGALLWTGDNWAVLCGLDPVQGILHIDKVKALFERSIAVDEMYWGASAHTALGALLVATPALFGGEATAGRAHLRRATELAPGFLYSHVAYAQYAGFEFDALGTRCAVRDAALIRERANRILEAPIGRWPFWDREAKREARVLREQIEAGTW
jgi:hypothetical protein